MTQLSVVRSWHHRLSARDITVARRACLTYGLSLHTRWYKDTRSWSNTIHDSQSAISGCSSSIDELSGRSFASRMPGLRLCLEEGLGRRNVLFCPKVVGHLIPKNLHPKCRDADVFRGPYLRSNRSAGHWPAWNIRQTAHAHPVHPPSALRHQSANLGRPSYSYFQAPAHFSYCTAQLCLIAALIGSGLGSRTLCSRR